VSAVKMELHRARRKLKEIVRELGKEGEGMLVD
jgi:hypothetical protein